MVCLCLLPLIGASALNSNDYYIYEPKTSKLDNIIEEDFSMSTPNECYYPAYTQYYDEYTSESKKSDGLDPVIDSDYTNSYATYGGNADNTDSSYADTNYNDYCEYLNSASDSNSNSNSDSNSNSNSDSNSNSNSNSDSNINSESNININSNSDSNINSESNININSNSDSNSISNVDSDNNNPSDSSEENIMNFNDNDDDSSEENIMNSNNNYNNNDPENEEETSPESFPILGFELETEPSPLTENG
jgi:hypothetical protein